MQQKTQYIKQISGKINYDYLKFTAQSSVQETDFSGIRDLLLMVFTRIKHQWKNHDMNMKNLINT